MAEVFVEQPLASPGSANDSRAKRRPVTLGSLISMPRPDIGSQVSGGLMVYLNAFIKQQN